jgi:hypothetical protein
MGPKPRVISSTQRMHLSGPDSCGTVRLEQPGGKPGCDQELAAGRNFRFKDLACLAFVIAQRP